MSDTNVTSLSVITKSLGSSQHSVESLLRILMMNPLGDYGQAYPCVMSFFRERSRYKIGDGKVKITDGYTRKDVFRVLQEIQRLHPRVGMFLARLFARVLQKKRRRLQ